MKSDSSLEAPWVGNPPEYPEPTEEELYQQDNIEWLKKFTDVLEDFPLHGAGRNDHDAKVFYWKIWEELDKYMEKQ